MSLMISIVLSYVIVVLFYITLMGNDLQKAKIGKTATFLIETNIMKWIKIREISYKVFRITLTLEVI